MLFDEPASGEPSVEQPALRLLTIRAADSDGHRSSAHVLVSRMYAGRGYPSAPLAETQPPGRITLIGTDHDVARGTITIGFNGSDALLADDCFRDILDGLRREGLVVCEFIKLAIDGIGRSRRVLASLFHTAFIYAHQIKGCDRIVIEVNPRHVRFYEEMLGFAVLTAERLNHRVNAPAVLLSLDLSFAERQILKIPGATPQKFKVQRSLYRHGFSHDEAEGIVRRFQRRARL
ncbi:MAG: N-acyl amino acid synthase FeeM domain-containing protein [Ginsengibacter sp.]